MGWRENMGVKNPKHKEQKPQKEQKPPEQTPFATIAPFAPKDQKIKTVPAPPPDLFKIQPGHTIETGFKPGLPSQVKKIPGIPADYIQSPAVWMPGSTPTDQDRDTCPACGKNQWWRLNKLDSKRICARCHPPATGLDVILERI